MIKLIYLLRKTGRSYGLSYSNIKSEYNSLIYDYVYNPSNTIDITEDQNSSGLNIIENSSEVDLFSAEILPELTYFISSKLGLCLSLGGIGYSMTDWKEDNSSWTINFNPAYWKFGIKIKI